MTLVLNKIMVILGTPVLAFIFVSCATLSIPTFDNAYVNQNVEQIRSLTHRADLIFVGTVTKVNPSPRKVSGRVKYTQNVNYRVDKVLKGFYSHAEIDIEHVLVANSRHLGPGNELDQAVFSTGNKLIVMAVRRDQLFYEDVNENFGTIPYSPQNETALIFAM